MGNQYGYTGLTPGLALKREAYRRGLRSGTNAKDYGPVQMQRAYKRFVARYGEAGELLGRDWIEGWQDARDQRDVKIIACKPSA